MKKNENEDDLKRKEKKKCISKGNIETSTDNKHCHNSTSNIEAQLLELTTTTNTASSSNKKKIHLINIAADNFK